MGAIGVPGLGSSVASVWLRLAGDAIADAHSAAATVLPWICSSSRTRASVRGSRGGGQLPSSDAIADEAKRSTRISFMTGVLP